MKRVILLLFILNIYTSCSMFDTDTPIPFFVEIPSVSLETTPEQGEPTHKITDVWVNANGQLLGVFPLPAKIPVIFDKGKEVKLTIFPGIRNNGVTESAFIYKLINPINITYTPQEGETFTETPVFRYSANTKFDLVESFETSNSFVFAGTKNADNGRLTTTTDMVEYGEKAGKITTSDDFKIIEIGSLGIFSGATGDTYIELDYKNDIPFFVGLYKTSNGVTTQVYNVLIPARDEWNKIYLDFTLDLSGGTTDFYRPMILVSNNASDSNEGNVYVDNIKLLHF